MKKQAILFLVVFAALISPVWADIITPTTSQLELEQQRIELERKRLFDSGNVEMQIKPSPLPSDAAVQKEMQRIDQDRKQLFDQRNAATQPGQNNFPNVATPEISNIDIQALAKRYEWRADARKMDDLMIFVSFSMPTESLKRIVAQARKVGASVVLNGFKENSLQKTAMAIKDLGEMGGNVLINPNAFVKYKVQVVPVVVLVKADAIDQVDNQGCALPDTYISVAGDVSLDYSLEEIGKQDSRFAELSQRYYRQLKGYQ